MSAATTQQLVQFGPIRQRLEQAIRDHSTLDSLWFNGGTVVTLILTALATLFSSKAFGDGYQVVGGILSAGAGVVIAIERALSLGGRWRFHTEMINGYRGVIDMIDFAALLPEGQEKQKYLQDIWTKLYALRAREASIPGTGTPQS